MIRLIVRTIGFWLMASAVVLAVHDGARSIAEGRLETTSIGDLWFAVDSASLNISQAAVERYVHPILWDPVILSVLLAPGVIVIALLGLFLTVLGRRRPRPLIEELDPR